MSRQSERDSFIAIWTKAGGSLSVARLLLHHAATAQRLAEAACNGDWPADNGERKVKICPSCEGGWVASSFRKGVCPSCRMDQIIEALVAQDGFKVKVEGDPRGYVVKVSLPDGREAGVPA